MDTVDLCIRLFTFSVNMTYNDVTVRLNNLPYYSIHNEMHIRYSIAKSENFKHIFKRVTVEYIFYNRLF
jgi:hypothetical protein